LSYQSVQSRLPKWLRRHVMHFDETIKDQVQHFAASLPAGARLLDAGAGECQYADFFATQRYVAVDLGVGDLQWNYTKLDAVADLTALPFPCNTFTAAVNIVTLEHVREPARAILEIARVLEANGTLLLIVPHEWEVHQSPHDYFRYTRHGVAYLLDQAGVEAVSIQPVGGYFRLMSRRLFNGLQFFPGLWFYLAAIFLVPAALVFPLFDALDPERNFTLGYICIGRKR
jgi:SAM-dependent methyltransferase